MIYGLREILLWVVRGWWQYFVLRHDLISWLRLPERQTAPNFWLDHFTQYQWEHYLDDNGRPNHIIWASRYRSCATWAYNAWLGVQTRAARDAAVDLVKGFTGLVLHSYTTFSAWIEAIWNRVGDYVPWWANSLVDAAVKLRDWFPVDIVNAWKSWDLIWAEIKGEVWSWVLARFDAAKDWVANHAPWVIDWINFLATWYNLVGTWVTSFKNDPYGTVAGWLGIAWAAWIGIRVDIVDFYNTVWSPFKVTLHDFLADPLGWMYDRVEDELIRRW